MAAGARPAPRRARVGTPPAADPCRATSSAVITPAPPPLVTTATRRPLGTGYVGQAGAEVDHLLRAGAGDHPGLPCRRLPDGRDAGHRARVRGRRSAAVLRQPRTQHHDRLDRRRAAGHLQEAPPVVDAFHVHHDARGVRIVPKVVEDVDRADLGLVSHAQRSCRCRCPAADRQLWSGVPMLPDWETKLSVPLDG